MQLKELCPKKESVKSIGSVPLYSSGFLWIQTNANGTAKYEATVADDDTTKNGAYTFTSNGITIQKGSFRNNMPDGKFETFYADGSKKMVQEYAEGKKHGQYLFYSENGTLIQRGSFENDRLEGTFEQFDDSGKINEKSTYKNFPINPNKKNS